MPTYEYKCESCARRFDAFQSMTDTPLETCEQCGGRLKRLIGTGAGIIFKGSGFYCTDYRSDSYRNSAKSDKPETPAAATPTTTAAATTPENSTAGKTAKETAKP